MKIFDIKAAALFLSLTESRIRYEVFHKRIPYFKVGRSIRFDEKDLINWVLNQKTEPRLGNSNEK